MAEGRDEAEAKLPATFPASGIRVIGSGAADLAAILAACTGLDVTIGSGDMLVVKKPATARTGKFSATAATELTALASVKDGIIIDTNPKGAAVEIGVFGQTTPGYQQLDIGNIKVLAAASGEKGGISACDAVMHEMAEAAFGRTLARKKLSNIGNTAYVPSHAEGIRVEEGIRTDLGLPQRSKTETGSMAIIGNETANTLVYLDSMVYGDGAAAKTQLSVYRCHVMPVNATTSTCDNEAVASTVVAGVVRFSTQMEALTLFNKYATAFGLQPIAVPATPAKGGK